RGLNEPHIHQIIEPLRGSHALQLCHDIRSYCVRRICDCELMQEHFPEVMPKRLLVRFPNRALPAVDSFRQVGCLTEIRLERAPPAAVQGKHIGPHAVFDVYGGAFQASRWRRVSVTQLSTATGSPRVPVPPHTRWPRRCVPLAAW